MLKQNIIWVIVTCLDFPEISFYGALFLIGEPAEKGVSAESSDDQVTLKIMDAIDEDGRILTTSCDRFGISGFDRLFQFFSEGRDLELDDAAFSALDKGNSFVFEQETDEHGLRRFEIARAVRGVSHGKRRSKRYLRRDCSKFRLLD